jgi:ABC-type multidrug transport system fused ATPase/permease subunit
MLTGYHDVFVVNQLIERFYDADAGAVLIDGRNVRDLNPKWLREHIGYINQEVSFQNNLTFIHYML